jgi:hypothetical protein
MASDSYLSVGDWCPGHHQSSTLTPSTACHYATTDCERCVGVRVLCVKGRNRTVINIYRVNPSSPARSHRPPTRLTSTRALLYLHMMVLGVSAPKTARSCDSCHTHSAHAKPHITADGAHHRAPLCAPTAPHSVVRHAPPPSWSAFSHP